MKLKSKLTLAVAGIIACAGFAHAGTVPGIGTQYFVYSLGTYNPEIPDAIPGNNWYLPGQNFRTPVGLRHLNPTLVDQQIDNMRNSGIDVLSIPLPITELASCENIGGACYDNFVDGVWGETLDDSMSQLRAQHQTNLRNIVRKARDRGFRYIYLRLNNYAPSGWTTWNEPQYLRAWNLLVNTRSLIYSELAGTPVKVIFDLAPEMPGNNSGKIMQYTQRIWSDYVAAFGTADTVGGSIIGDPAFLPGIAWFGATKPAIYAFDIYQFGANSVGTSLANSWNSLPAAEKTKPVILMETYHNEATTSASLQTALAANPGMNVIAVVQWPTTRDPCAVANCGGHVRQSAVNALATTTQISNYLPIAQALVSDNTNASVLNFTDVNCGSTSGTCTINANLNSAPVAGKPAYKVYLRSYTSPSSRTLMTCNAASNTVSINWIQPYTGYFFEYWPVASCSDDPTGSPAYATSVVSAR